jgi:thioredoxin reductase (NADPH)
LAFNKKKEDPVQAEPEILEQTDSQPEAAQAEADRLKGEADEAEKDIKIDGFFLAIGHHQNSEVFRKYIHVDEQGYILTEGSSTRTNVPGVFAAGDIMDPVYRQGIAAAGMGCRAAIDVERYLGELESK